MNNVVQCSLAGILDAILEDVDDVASWVALEDCVKESGITVGTDWDLTTCQSKVEILKLVCVECFKDEDNNGADLVELHNEYVEPGYSPPSTGLIATGNWNRAKKLGDLLEELGVECEWSDEWTTCGQCGKLVRTQPDWWSWLPYYECGDGGVTCHRCHEPTEGVTAEEITAAVEAMSQRGERDGQAAGACVADGNTSESELRETLEQWEDGDPAAPEAPYPFSGEWADNPTPEEVIRNATDLDVELLTPEQIDELAEAYEQAYMSAWQESAETTVRNLLPEGEDDED